VEGILFTFKVLGLSYALGNIGEWLPPNFQKYQTLELWLMLLLLALFARGIRLSPVRLTLLLGLIHLSLSHVRHVELLGVLGPMLLASAIGTQWAASREGNRHTQALDRVFTHLARPASPTSIALTFVLVGVLAYYKVQQGGIAPPDKRHPIAAVQFIRDSGIRGPVYNQYDFGGYLIYSGFPVFIDGRADMYGDAFLRRYLETQRLPKSNGLEKLLDEHHVGWTLLTPATAAADYLDMLPNWRRAYADGTAVVHVRAPVSGLKAQE
jgi:hypothetical protein